MMAQPASPDRDLRSAAMRNIMTTVANLSVVTFFIAPVMAGEEVTASNSLTIQPTGPRSGEAGSKYFNIEGKDNGKYASFGVLVFEIPKKIDASKIKSLSLTLVQSIPQFAKDGTVKIFLAPELDPAAELKFDSNSDNGIGDQIKVLNELCSGTFKKVKTGETQSLTLNLDDACKERIAKGGRLCLVIVPADSTVAATYFGANENDKSNSPKFTMDLP
jgi:hypothetical protein